MTLRTEIETTLGKFSNYWESALDLGALMNSDKSKEEVCQDLIAKIQDHQGSIAMESQKKTMVVMGTSGWRDRIGEGFSRANVVRTVQGIIEMMRSETFLKINSYKSFEEVKKDGILVFRDNRFLGEEFKAEAIRELTAEGILVYDGGECPTGVGSAVQTSLGAAGSLNFTPSHNPMDYQGLKFNPKDGGPAPQELTSLIEVEANKRMESFVPSEKGNDDLLKRVDSKKIYLEYFLSKNIFDLDRIRNWLKQNSNDIKLVIDYMHGSSRGFVEELFGSELISKLQSDGSLELLHQNDDFSFHGLKPEPSAKNQAPLIDILKKSKRKFTLAVAMDPDADRIRFSDAQLDMDMNCFASVAYQIQLGRHKNAGIVSTAPSSDFALEMAKQNGQDVYETAVGFKYFRPYLGQNRVCMAFEESDGISFGNHTLEKDALIGLIAALDSMVSTGKNISEQYELLRKRYGYFYPQKAGVDVKGVSVEKWQEYKKEVVSILKEGLFSVGDSIEVGNDSKKIETIQTVDGLKLSFADRSWILLRPSGTEPKFRIYFEVVSDSAIKDIGPLLDHYREAGTKILEMARERV